MTMYGYARVSTRDQDLSLQEHELRSAGCAKVYREKASGAKADRAELVATYSSSHGWIGLLGQRATYSTSSMRWPTEEQASSP